MGGIKIGIGRISTKDQNPQRQIDAFHEHGIEDRYIFIDICTGNKGYIAKRDEYQKAKIIAREGDTIFLDALDRLGRNAVEIEKEWRYFTEEVGCDMVVLNMPMLDTRGRMKDDPTGNLVSKLVLSIMAWMAQQETEERKRRQRGGIEAAKARGVYTGRQPVKVDTKEFGLLYEAVLRGERTNKYVMDKMDLKRTTYYKLVEEYKTKTGRFEE